MIAQKPQLLSSIKHPFLSNTVEAWLIGVSLACVTLGSATLLYFFNFYHGNIYPNIYIDGQPLAGLSRQESLTLLSENQKPIPTQVVIAVDTISVSSSAAQLQLHRDYESAVNQAYNHGRNVWLLEKLYQILKLQSQPLHIDSQVIADQEAIQAQTQELAQKVNIIGEQPSAKLRYSASPGSLSINPGKPGRAVETNKLATQILTGLADQTDDLWLKAPVASTAAVLTDSQIIEAQTRALRIVGQKIIFQDQEQPFTLRDQELISFLAFPEGYKPQQTLETIEDWKEIIDRESQDPTFEYNPETLEVINFEPPLDGRELDIDQTQQYIVDGLQKLEQQLAAREKALETQSQDSPTEPLEDLTYDLPVHRTSPEQSLGDTNDLGIKELIGHGYSEYDHSIPTRIHNVKITADRISNTIIAPGEEFSFNKTLGEVSRRTGYQPAYVISGGRTILGDGGGVCQVSTTTFRAALDAGLDITRRIQHSYRVSYYELNAKPGIDATVYSGNVDFRFKNDTDHHILLHSAADSDNLTMYVDIYGTSDGRTTEITEHKTWGARGAPAPVYSDDPSLPTGVIKQVDWAVSGIKASFKNVIRDKDGNLIREDEYYSNYIPWSAKYVRGTG